MYHTNTIQFADPSVWEVAAFFQIADFQTIKISSPEGNGSLECGFDGIMSQMLPPVLRVGTTPTASSGHNSAAQQII